MLSAGAALIGILVGAVAASIVLLTWSRSRVSTARGERERLLADAEREAEAVRREAQVDAREQAVALRSEIEREVQDRRVEIAKIEERVLPRSSRSTPGSPSSSARNRGSGIARFTSRLFRRSSAMRTGMHSARSRRSPA